MADLDFTTVGTPNVTDQIPAVEADNATTKILTVQSLVDMAPDEVVTLSAYRAPTAADLGRIYFLHGELYIAQARVVSGTPATATFTIQTAGTDLNGHRWLGAVPSLPRYPVLTGLTYTAFNRSDRHFYLSNENFFVTDWIQASPATVLGAGAVWLGQVPDEAAALALPNLANGAWVVYGDELRRVSNVVPAVSPTTRYEWVIIHNANSGLPLTTGQLPAGTALASSAQRIYYTRSSTVPSAGLPASFTPDSGDLTGTPAVYNAANRTISGVTWYRDAADATGTDQLYAVHVDTLVFNGGVNRVVFGLPAQYVLEDTTGGGGTVDTDGLLSDPQFASNALTFEVEGASDRASVDLSSLANTELTSAAIISALEDSIDEAAWATILPDDAAGRRIIRGSHLGEAIIGFSPLGLRIVRSLPPTPPAITGDTAAAARPVSLTAESRRRVVSPRTDATGYELIPAGTGGPKFLGSHEEDVTVADDFIATGFTGWTTASEIEFRVGPTDGIGREHYRISVADLLALTASAAGATASTENALNVSGVFENDEHEIRFGRTAANELLVTTTHVDADLNPLQLWTIDRGDPEEGVVRSDIVQSFDADARARARTNIGAAAQGTGEANLILPTTQGFETTRTIRTAFAGTTFSGQTSVELSFAPQLTAAAGSFLNLEFEFDGTGTPNGGSVWLGRRQGAAIFRELDASDPNHDFLDIDVSQAQTLSARLHTSAAEEQSDGTFRWRILLGSNSSGTLTAGTISVRGTIAEPNGETVHPNAWRQVFSEPGGLAIPYRTDSTTFMTGGQIFALDVPINRHQVSLVRLDIEPSLVASYGATHPVPEIILSMDSVWAHRTIPNTTPFTHVQYEPNHVLSIHGGADGYGRWGWGGGDTNMGTGIGFQWVQNNLATALTSITHFSIVYGISLSPWSTGRVNGIYVL